jgi:hypothetical protein
LGKSLLPTKSTPLDLVYVLSLDSLARSLMTPVEVSRRLSKENATAYACSPDIQ